MTSHSKFDDVSILWMNSAETFVDIFREKSTKEKEDIDENNRIMNFLSESGKMEFFVFANSI